MKINRALINSRSFILFMLTVAGLMSATVAFAKQHVIFGLSEMVALMPSGIQLPAKLDTGAKMSSLSATDIRVFKQNGQALVQFRLIDQRRDLDTILTYPLKRYVKIKKRADVKAAGPESSRRPVIEVPICMGSGYHVTQVNLIDRRHFIYPMLIGRKTIIEFSGVIDPSKRKKSTLACPELEAK